MVPAIVRRLAFVVCLALPGWAVAAPAPAEKPKDVDLVLCLDTSNSMDGLIDSAKLKLWDVVNELARVKPTPNLRVGLYSYGNNGHDKGAGWVKKELDLSTDLDEVYATLNGLKTNGGNELVARVSRDALRDQPWSKRTSALKIVFVCGNEAADQDKDVTLTDVAKSARDAGVIVNAIYCGPAEDGIAPGWRSFATAGNGSFANIDQDRAGREKAIPTPFDKELLGLNGRLNKTYLAYGQDGKQKAEQQQVQDFEAKKATKPGAAPTAALGRTLSKANALYRNSAWDLLDRMKEDKEFDLSKLKDEDLPEELRKLQPAERGEYLKTKAAERATVQKEINDLSAKRAEFIAKARKDAPPSDDDKALDVALKSIIREQAKAVGFEVPVEKK